MISNDFYFEDDKCFIEVVQRNKVKHTVIIDICDFDRLSEWSTIGVMLNHGNYYARAFKCEDGCGTLVLLHTLILYNPNTKEFKIDHKNCNSLDNTRDNLRLITSKQNAENRAGANKNSKTGIRGIYPVGRKFRVVGHDNGNHHLGYFDTIEEAERAITFFRSEYLSCSEMDKPYSE